MPTTSILVIGGGVAGHDIAYRLRDAADVTLVDPKTYWEVPMAVPRLLVEPDALPARLSYPGFLGRARHVQGRVVALADRSARIALGAGGEETVAFDHAVIATGSAYLDPLIKAAAPTEAERAAELRAMHGRLEGARSVVVVGGGPVGVEVAAELRETFPRTPVTLVHGGSAVLDAAPSRFSEWAAGTLRDAGVAFVTDDRVGTPRAGDPPPDGKGVTAAGRTLDADAVVWAAGARPVTDFVARGWPEAVGRDGLVRVDRYLRVVGHETVFAVGDVADTPENRLAIVAEFHAKSVAANLRRLAAGGASAAKLKPYKPARPGRGMGKLMIVSLGRRDGLTSLPFGQFRLPLLARTIKSRDMLVGSARRHVAA